MRVSSIALLAACTESPGDSTAGGELLWYETCGDPACGGYDETAHEGVRACTTEVAGAACGAKDGRCDPVDDCNVELVCAVEDPKDQPGGCPISLRDAKADIVYVDADRRGELHAELVRIPLAEYRYRTEPAARHLGFVIEDQPAASAAVMARGDRVDLYGYASLAVAAIQVQDARIRELEARLLALEEGATATCEP
jgi:hypothetical protein